MMADGYNARRSVINTEDVTKLCRQIIDNTVIYVRSFLIRKNINYKICDLRNYKLAECVHLPSLLIGFLLKSARSKLCASALRNWGIPSLALKIQHRPWYRLQTTGG